MKRPILGIETTCDETSAAVLDAGGTLASLVIHSQDIHRIYGGVVPELAARDHLRRIEPVVEAALGEAGAARSELGAIAVAAAPGLIGALLVGVTWSRAAAFALGVPWVPVHHMEGHLFGPVLEDSRAEPPFVALLVSGGHTMLLWVPRWGRYHLLGETRDDAAGEAFDKVARALGLPYPGGPAVQRLAESGDPSRYDFPRPMLRRGGGRPRSDRAGDRFDFSFSGLKTAVSRTVTALETAGRLAEERAHVAASFQEAVVDVLTTRTLDATVATGCDRVLLGGGVSANGPLRERFRAKLSANGRLFVGSPRISLDNGAMIARAGLFRLSCGAGRGGATGAGDWALRDAQAGAPIPGLRGWAGVGIG